jgi:hypothetical protein
MVKRKAVVPDTPGDKIVDRLRDLYNHNQPRADA